MQSDRIIGLDIVRAMAIMMVVTFHSCPILTPLATIPGAGGVIHKVLSLSEPMGLLGVEMFFALSGFLIGTILIKAYVRSTGFGFTDIKNFLVRRWFRTLPNYWLILILNIAVYRFLGLYTLPQRQISYFFFVQNLWYAHPVFFPEAWSLAVEEWFYLTLPLTIFLCAKVFKGLIKKRIILLTFIVYAFLFLLLRLLSGHSITNPLYFDSGIRKIVLYRLDAIAYGFFMAYLIFFHKERVLKLKRKLLFTGIAGILLMTAIHFAGIYPSFDYYRKYYYYRFFINTILLSLIPLFFSLCIPYASAYRDMGNKTIARIIEAISKISYSLYLIHFSLIYIPFWQYRRFTVFNCIPFYILYWLVIISVSLLIYRYYEYPIMNLRRKFSKEDPKVE